MENEFIKTIQNFTNVSNSIVNNGKNFNNFNNKVKQNLEVIVLHINELKKSIKKLKNAKQGIQQNVYKNNENIENIKTDCESLKNKKFELEKEIKSLLDKQVKIINEKTKNAFDKNEEVSLTIVAENGTLKLGGEYMNEVIYQNPVLIHIEQIEKGNTANDYGTYKGSMSNHDKVYDNIIRALNGDENKVTDGEAALKTVAFIEKIYTQIPVQS